MTFAETIKKGRVALAMTQAQLAELFGVSKRRLEMWERGEGGDPALVVRMGAHALIEMEKMKQRKGRARR